MPHVLISAGTTLSKIEEVDNDNFVDDKPQEVLAVESGMAKIVEVDE